MSSGKSSVSANSYGVPTWYTNTTTTLAKSSSTNKTAETKVNSGNSSVSANSSGVPTWYTNTTTTLAKSSNTNKTTETKVYSGSSTVFENKTQGNGVTGSTSLLQAGYSRTTGNNSFSAQAGVTGINATVSGKNASLSSSIAKAETKAAVGWSETGAKAQASVYEAKGSVSIPIPFTGGKKIELGASFNILSVGGGASVGSKGASASIGLGLLGGGVSIKVSNGTESGTVYSKSKTTK